MLLNIQSDANLPRHNSRAAVTHPKLWLDMIQTVIAAYFQDKDYELIDP